jgi:GT2 family glycosyltransferase
MADRFPRIDAVDDFTAKRARGNGPPGAVKPMPRFSIIITVFNRPELVRQAINSARAQTFTNHEIIVVDDASTDATPEILKSYGDKIRVVTQAKNEGSEVANNAGVAVAQGSYLAFLDSDDLLYSWALETYDFVLARTGQPALLVSRLAYFSTTPQPVQVPSDGDAIELIVYKDYLSRDRTIGSSLSMIVVRQDVYAEVGGFRQSTASTFYDCDHDFLLRVGCHGPAMLIESPHTVAYRIHPGNSVRNIRRVAEGIRRLIRAERNGNYPGGRERRLDRRAVIGNQTYWWSRCAFLQGQPWLAATLLLAGFDMILARLVKRFQTAIRGLTPTTRLQRGEPVPPVRPSQ